MPCPHPLPSRVRGSVPATTPTTPPATPPHGPVNPAEHHEPGTLPPQIDDPDPADIPEVRDPPEIPRPRLRGPAVPARRAPASHPSPGARAGYSLGAWSGRLHRAAWRKEP